MLGESSRAGVDRVEMPHHTAFGQLHPISRGQGPETRRSLALWHRERTTRSWTNSCSDSRRRCCAVDGATAAMTFVGRHGARGTVMLRTNSDATKTALSRPVDKYLVRIAVVASIAAATSLAYGAVHSSRLQRQIDARSGGYKPGDQFGQPQLMSASADATLVIWIDPRCGACQASAEFYRELSSRSFRTHLAVAAPEPRSTLDAFMREHAIQIASRFTFDEQSARQLGNVPSLTLTGRDGVVLKRWRGLLDRARQQEVLETLVGLEDKKLQSAFKEDR